MRRLIFLALLACPLFASGQDGIRLPERPEPGIDPRLAPSWLTPDIDRFGFVQYQWRNAAGFTPSPRMNWSYSFNDRSTLGMSVRNAREYDPERQVSVFGRYWLSSDWAVSAESLSREPGNLFRMQDFRIGVQRRF